MIMWEEVKMPPFFELFFYFLCNFEPTFMLFVLAHLFSKDNTPRGTSALVCKLLQTGSQAPLSITLLLV